MRFKGRLIFQFLSEFNSLIIKSSTFQKLIKMNKIFIYNIKYRLIKKLTEIGGNDRNQNNRVRYKGIKNEKKMS